MIKAKARESTESAVKRDIINAMTKRGVTQTELAARMGCPKQRVNRALLHSVITMDTADRMAVALGLRLTFSLK